MNKVMTHWEIQQKWQLIYPVAGAFALLYIGYRIANSLNSLMAVSNHILNFLLVLMLTLIVAYVLYKTITRIFEKVANRWRVTYKWELITIFMVFSVTGTTSVAVGRPFLSFIGINQTNLTPILYYPLFIIGCFIFYQVFLVLYGWLFGQHQFFWAMEKKMLKRFGIHL